MFVVVVKETVVVLTVTRARFRVGVEAERKGTGLRPVKRMLRVGMSGLESGRWTKREGRRRV